jgi:hypothetical protein
MNDEIKNFLILKEKYPSLTFENYTQLNNYVENYVKELFEEEKNYMIYSFINQIEYNPPKGKNALEEKTRLKIREIFKKSLLMTKQLLIEKGIGEDEIASLLKKAQKK